MDPDCSRSRARAKTRAKPGKPPGRPVCVERSIGGRTQSIIGRGYKELELSQVNSCDTD